VSCVLAASLILPVLGTAQSGSSSNPSSNSPSNSAPHDPRQTLTAVAQAPPPLIEQHLDLSGVDPAIVNASQSALQASFTQESDHDHAVEFLPLAPASHSLDTDSHDTRQVDQLTDLEPVLATRNADTKPFTLVGITSSEPFAKGARILVRVEEETGWSSWTTLDVSMDQPDGAEAENILYGTQPLLTNSATGVEVRIDTPDGAEVVDPAMVLLDSPTIKSDAAIPEPDFDSGNFGPISTVAASTVSAPMPAIISRSEWGADESLRRSGPKFAPTIKAAFIHHTASKSNYTPEEAPSQMRNLYTYFTKGLKYSDMAYNFIVDRFGRLYEGRGGGIDKAVVGGHTAGFNDQTFAISALGNFQTFKPNDPEMLAMVDSVSSLLAWKLSMNHRDPNGQTTLVSDSGAGTSKYKPGQTAAALVVGGHGDIGSTSCPGKHLEAQLPAIRAAAGAKMGASMINPAAVAANWGEAQPVRIAAVTNAPLQWNLSIRSQCGDVVRSLSGGQEAPGQLGIDWDKNNDAGQRVPPGTYTVTMNSNGNGEVLYPWVGQARVLATADSPPDPCAPPESFTLTGSGFGHGVGLSQWGARAMAIAGMDATSIVSFYYQGSQVVPVQDDMEISVNLEYQKSRVDMQSEALDGTGGALEVSVGGVVTQGSPADIFQFEQSSGQVKVVKISGGASSVIGQGPSATARPLGATLVHVTNKARSLSQPGSRFRYGYVEVTPIKVSGKVLMNAVNKLRLRDEYLYGVAEVSSSWPNAALQAQVLAARTYALSKIDAGLRKSCNCHLDDGYGPFSDQAFAGCTKQSSAQGERWVAAVNATHASPNTGLAILKDGRAIKAFYSSSNGGASQAVSDAWGGENLPYLISVADPYSLDPSNPDASWTKVITQAQVARAFGVPAVWQLAITERTTAGAVKTLAATLTDGSVITKTGNEMRTMFGLKSTYVTAIDGNAGIPVAQPAAPGALAPVTQAPAGERSVLLLTTAKADQPAGKAFNIKAKVDPAKKGLRVWLQQRVGEEWKTISKKKTKAKGRITFAVKDPWPPSTTQVYRIVTTKKKIIVGTSAELGIGVVPSVRQRTLSLLSPATVSKKDGKSFVIKAKMRPGTKGLTVWRQVLASGDPETGEWLTVGKTKTKAGGKISFTVKKATPAGTTYLYRLVVIDNRQAAGVSPITTLTVT
jgi:SpoIID/LytB domain protein